MLNARVTATIAQVRSYEAAATTFRDSFASLPGDMIGAANRLPGCTGFCNPPAVTAGGGNSIIGNPAWAAAGAWANQTVALANGNAENGETVLFWIHLLQADLISGVSSEALTGAAPQWGITNPQARINGGFVVGYASGANPPPGGTAGGTNPSGMVLALIAGPTDGLQTTAGIQPLNPAKAAQLDRKMDDGRPTSGFVQSFGVATSCNATVGGIANQYNEPLNRNDCGLVFRIQG